MYLGRLQILGCKNDTTGKKDLTVYLTVGRPLQFIGNRNGITVYWNVTRQTYNGPVPVPVCFASLVPRLYKPARTVQTAGGMTAQCFTMGPLLFGRFTLPAV